MTRQKSKEGAFMINSIQHFQEKGVKNLTEIFSHYTDDYNGSVVKTKI